jgi:hypothetical protein
MTITSQFDLTFATQAEAADFFAALDYRRLPVRQETYAAQGRNDDGLAIVTFARRNLVDDEGLHFHFSEVNR